MIQSDDFLDEKSLRKDQIEHAKMIYERNKEIYKYTFESMKFLDSKLTRAMTLITFMFTVQTGFITLVIARLESGLGKNFLILIAVLTFTLLMISLIKVVSLSQPKERPMLSTNQTHSNREMNNFTQTLQLYVNISDAFAAAHEGLENRNFTQANSLILVHKMLLLIYTCVCVSAFFVCFLSLNSL